MDADDPGGGGEGDGEDDTTKKKVKIARNDAPKNWYRFRVITPTSSILRGSFAMGDPRFKFKSRGRQAAACSVVAIVYGRLFEPKDWITDYVDQVLEYGDNLFRISVTRKRLPDNQYLKATLVHPEFYIGNYKVQTCVEQTGIYGNLFSDTPGCPDFADGLRRFFETNNAGVVTAQGSSVAIWSHQDIGFLFFEPAACAEDGSKSKDGVACLMRFKCMNEMRDHFLKAMDKRYDSRYCIDNVKVLRVNEIGTKYMDRQPGGDRSAGKQQLVVDRSVLQSINPVDIEENKMDCTKPAPKDIESKAAPLAAQIRKEPLLITISNYSIDRKFATDPLVDQNSFDTGYPYEGLLANVPSTFKELPGHVAILHGILHESSEMFKSKGTQNVANCLMAIAMKKVHPVKTWVRQKLDEILALGDALHARIKSEKPGLKTLTGAEFDNANVFIEDRKMVIDVDLITVTGTLTSKVPSVLNLKQALEEFFLLNKEGLIETSSMAMAIWSQEDYYYSFDPRKCDQFGVRIIEEKGRGGKGGKGGATEKKAQGHACVVRFPTTDALAGLFLKNVDPSKKNDRFTIRHITVVDDIPGTREWNDFAPGVPHESWILQGGISNDDESLQGTSRGIQGLAMPVVALVNAKEISPAKWTKETIDDTVREGDNYYNFCNPVTESEGAELVEKTFLVTNLKKNFYLKNRKVKVDVDEAVVLGELQSSNEGENDIVKNQLNLEEGIAKFFENNQYGIVEVGNLAVGIWKAEEEVMEMSKEELQKVKKDFYYCFDPNPRSGVSNTAGKEDEEASACVLRAVNPAVLAKFIEKNAKADAEPPQEPAEDKRPVEVSDFNIHGFKVVSLSEPMTEEELEKDKETPVAPDLNNYVSIGDAGEGALLLGSFNQAHEILFKPRTRDKQQAAISLAALAMKRLYNPHLWYRDVVDDVLKLGDKVATENLANLPEPEEEGEEEPRDYLLPSELGEEIIVGVNRMSVGLEAEAVSGTTSELAKVLEEFFEGTVSQGIFRQGNVMIPIWKEDNVFFMLDPRGRDSRGDPSENKDSAAAVMWFTDIASLARRIQAVSPGSEFVVDAVSMGNVYETRVPETDRPKRTTSGEDLWHHFPKFADGVWSITGQTTMADERFDESNRNKQSAAIAVIAVVFSKVYEPRRWTAAILDEVIVTGDKLHSKCVERLGKENLAPRVNEIITEFFLSNRRIDLAIKDCVEAGDLSGKPPKLQNLRSGLKNFFSEYTSGALILKADRNIAVWTYDGAYYCLIPNWNSVSGTEEEGKTSSSIPTVFRFLNVELLTKTIRDHLGTEGDYEITAIDVVDWNKLPPWKFDPSPAVRPSNLPPLNAYRRLEGEARAILRGGHHQGDEIFPESIRNRQSAANCVVALGMAVVKSPITWTKSTLDEILAIGIGVHRETNKAKPSKVRLRPKDIIRVFYVGVNILTADIEENTVTGLVAIRPPDPEEKKKKGKRAKKKAKTDKSRKKGKGTQRVRPPPPPPILLEEGLRKFFENNRAGVLATERGMVAIWKDLGVYFMYDPRARSDRGLPDEYGTSCTMWFACLEPFYDVVFANIDEQEKYGKFEISRVIIRTAMIEPLPCPASFRPFVDCTVPAIPTIPTISPKKAITLAVETVTEYNPVDEELSVLRGSQHMGHRNFSPKNRGLQSTAISAVAIVVGLLHVPSTWTPQLIDAVLKYGDLLHSDTVRSVRPGARNLSPSELLTVFIVGDFRANIHIHNHTAAGILHVYDLSEALALFFRNNCAGILHTTNTSVAVMQHYGKFYLFDPCSRDERGMPGFDGAACLFRCASIMKMAKVFVTNCNLKKPNVYTLNAVNVLSLQFFSAAKTGCPPKCEQ